MQINWFQCRFRSRAVKKNINMPSLIFDTCCDCIKLKTGCFIIGYLELVAELIITIVVLLALVTGGAAAASDDKVTHAAGVVILACGIILMLILVLLLAFTITLLVGLHKNKRGHVRAYLVYSTIFMVIEFIVFFVSCRHLLVQTIISNLIGLLIYFYFHLVIRSQYHKMDDANKGATYNTA